MNSETFPSGEVPPDFSFTTNPDEAIEWRMEPPCSLVAVGTKLMSRATSYPLLVVPVEAGRTPSAAEFTATIGRLSPQNFAESFRFPLVKPLRQYLCAYKEYDLWHWTLCDVPLELIPVNTTPRGFTLHINHSESPDVVGLMVKITSRSGFLSEREYPIDLMEICPVTGHQVLAMRHLTTYNSYTILARPMMADGTLGRLSLPLKMRTLPQAVVSVLEAGATYFRIGIQRPKWQGAIHMRDMTEDNARIGECLVEVWEDPRDSLKKNAIRLVKGRLPQRYPLQRRIVTAENIPVGTPLFQLFDRLRPDTPHFVVVRTKTDTTSWDDPIRVILCTAPESPIVAPIKASSIALQLQWNYIPSRILPRCSIDVEFPSETNMFNDRDESHPYVGDRAVLLPDGGAWAPVNVASKDFEALVSHFEASVTDMETGHTIFLKIPGMCLSTSLLSPATAYIVKIRSCLKTEFAGTMANPWSRPLLVMTPSAMLCRVVHRTSSTLRLAFGRRIPPAVMPMEFPPGRQKYLPDINTPSPQYYYYLEPLPFLCGPEIETEHPPSDSESEEQVYARDVDDADEAYFGTRPRIRNREPRPEPLFDMPIEVLGNVTAVTLLLVRGPHVETEAFRVSSHNDLRLDVITEFCEAYHPIVVRVEKKEFGISQFDDLEADQEYTVYHFSQTGDEGECKLDGHLTVKTLSENVTGSSPPEVEVTNPVLWGALVTEQRGKQPANYKLEVNELSEVFVVVHAVPQIDEAAAPSVAQLLLGCLVHRHSSSADHDGECAKSETTAAAAVDETSRDDSRVCVEYLVRVRRTVMKNDRWVEESMRYVYFANSTQLLQIVDLLAAARYELSVAVMNNATQQWSDWSQSIAVTTVQRLNMDLIEVSSQYIKLRWHRAKMDGISEYAMTLKMLHPDRVLGDAPPKEPVKVLAITETHKRLSIFDDLQCNAMYDCSVVPMYVNGQVGLSSNAIRFVHCVVAARIVECGVNHLLIEWQEIDPVALVPPCMRDNQQAFSHVSARFLLRIRQGTVSEHTYELDSNCHQHVVTGLSPLTEYIVNVSYVAVVPRCDCCKAPCPLDVTPCAPPFSVRGATLTQPSAEVHKLGESCVELTWEFYTEAHHEGKITMEVRFHDNQRGESFNVYTTCEAQQGATSGFGSTTIEGLLPERLYVVYMRQQYSRGTWGDWKMVLKGVSTLRRIQAQATHINETFFHLTALRQAWTVQEGTHESMSRAEHINPPRWQFLVTHVETNEALTVEANTPSCVVSGLEPNTPYKIVVRQWSIADWGEPSQPLYAYTLQTLIPIVLVRADNYLAVGCSRDRRPPSIQTSFCKPHDEASAAAVSSLVSVKYIATSLLNDALPEEQIVVQGTEATGGHLRGVIRRLHPAHPYRVDLVPEYKEDVPATLTSLATITLSMPETAVVDYGEDSFTLAWQASKSSITHYATFSCLPPGVRHAPRDGVATKVKRWQVKAEPVEHNVTAFQNPSVNESLVTVDEGASICTIGGLLPETEYILSQRSIDEDGNEGWFIQCSKVKTAKFVALSVNKIAENFVELSWNPEEGVRQGAATSLLNQHQRAAGDRRSLALGVSFSATDNRRSMMLGASFSAGNFSGLDQSTSPGAAPTAGGENQPEEKKDPTHLFEVLVFDVHAPDFENAKKKLVDFQRGSVLIEDLEPKTQYAAISRSHRVIRGQTVQGTWGAQARFETLSLLVLRVVAISLDFVDVTWRGTTASDDKPLSQQPTSKDAANPAHHKIQPEQLQVTFPSQVLGSSTYFCNATNRSTLGSASANAVRFQVRVMHADSKGRIGELKEDIFVTESEDGIHTVNKLQPKQSYAIKMRVCYEAISGSWVEPAVVTTDHIPDARVVRITQNSADFTFCVAPAKTHPRLDLPLEKRRHRLYEICVRERGGSQFVIVDGTSAAPLHLIELKRDHLYNVDLREIIRGDVHGDFSLLTTFWTQPYPPVITELVECRDGVCEMHWGVMDSRRIGYLLEMEKVPPGFVYSLERGIRNATNPHGCCWKEIAITDQPCLRFNWRDLNSSKAVQLQKFSRLCFRVRLSKLFVHEPGFTCKVPVWGDYSPVAYWDEPSPPSPVGKLRVHYVSSDLAVIRWNLPDNYHNQPQLSFSVFLDAGRALPAAPAGAELLGADTSQEWFFVEKTRQLSVFIGYLQPNTHYRVAVRGESTFGIAPTANILAFVTRIVPNVDTVTSVPNVNLDAMGIKGLAPRQVGGIRGLVPGAPEEETNLFDKYEALRLRQRKAACALAGISNKPKKPNIHVLRMHDAVRKITAMLQALREAALQHIRNPAYNCNEELSPMQVARVKFGMSPNNDDLIWNPQHFKIKDNSYGKSTEEQMAIAFEKLAQDTTPKIQPQQRKCETLDAEKMDRTNVVSSFFSQTFVADGGSDVQQQGGKAHIDTSPPTILGETIRSRSSIMQNSRHSLPFLNDAAAVISPVGSSATSPSPGAVKVTVSPDQSDRVKKRASWSSTVSPIGQMLRHHSSSVANSKRLSRQSWKSSSGFVPPPPVKVDPPPLPPSMTQHRDSGPASPLIFDAVTATSVARGSADTTAAQRSAMLSAFCGPVAESVALGGSIEQKDSSPT